MERLRQARAQKDAHSKRQSDIDVCRQREWEQPTLSEGPTQRLKISGDEGMTVGTVGSSIPIFIVVQMKWKSYSLTHEIHVANATYLTCFLCYVNVLVKCVCVRFVLITVTVWWLYDSFKSPVQVQTSFSNSWDVVLTRYEVTVMLTFDL